MTIAKETCPSCHGDGSTRCDEFHPWTSYGHAQSEKLCRICDGLGWVATPGVGLLPYFDGIDHLWSSIPAAEDMASCDGSCGTMTDCIREFWGEVDAAGLALYSLRWVPGGIERLRDSVPEGRQ